MKNTMRKALALTLCLGLWLSSTPPLPVLADSGQPEQAASANILTTLAQTSLGNEYRYALQPEALAAQVDGIVIKRFDRKSKQWQVLVFEQVAGANDLSAKKRGFFYDASDKRIHTKTLIERGDWIVFYHGDQAIGKFSNQGKGFKAEAIKDTDHKGNVKQALESLSYTYASKDGFAKLTMKPNISNRLTGFEVDGKPYTKGERYQKGKEVYAVNMKDGTISIGIDLKNGQIVTLKDGNEVIGHYKKTGQTMTKVDSAAPTPAPTPGDAEASTYETIKELAEFNRFEGKYMRCNVRPSSMTAEIAKVLVDGHPYPIVADINALLKTKPSASVNKREGTLFFSDPSMEGRMIQLYNAKGQEIGRFSVGKYHKATAEDIPGHRPEMLTDMMRQAGASADWDMVPYDMAHFADQEKEKPSQVAVPQTMKNWYGSHTSGTYGTLGYAVRQGTAPHQRLLVGNGAQLTMHNMKALSSVEIVVQKGSKFNFNDSSLYGKITVEEGGRLQMNYDPAKKEFNSGSSINGQVVLKDGATLESSIIYSHANFLTDGKDAHRIQTPVIKVEGQVAIEGKVYVRGDDAPTGEGMHGQPAIGLEPNATLTIGKGSELGAYGGGKIATTTDGGNAILMADGSMIKGEGKLIAVGGAGQAGVSGKGVDGIGTIATAEAFLQGGDLYNDKNDPAPGNAAGIQLSSLTKGVSKPGRKSPKDIDNKENPYWTGYKAPGSDANEPNPLLQSKTDNAGSIDPKGLPLEPSTGQVNPNPKPEPTPGQDPDPKPATTYEVTFELDGGKAPKDEDHIAFKPQQIAENTFAKKPSVDPVKDGYDFLGWFATGADKPFDFDKTPITAALTLTAHWAKKEAPADKIVVRFDLDGGVLKGKDSVPEQTFTLNAQDAKVTDPGQPTKKGHTFDGWHAVVDGNVANKAYDFEQVLDTKKAKTLTLKALWKKDKKAEPRSESTRHHRGSSRGGNWTAPSAQGQAVKIVFHIGDNTIAETIDKTTAKRPMDAKVFIEADRARIPVRFAAQPLGIKVDWQQATKTVLLSKGDRRVEVPVDADYVMIDGKKVAFDNIAILRDGRVYLTPRALVRALELSKDLKVDWDEATQTVTISGTR